MLGAGPGGRGRDHGRAGAGRARGTLTAVLRRDLLLAATLWALVVLSREAAERHPEVVERLYAREVYAVVARLLSAATGWISFSLAEAVVVAAVVASVAWMARHMVRRRKRDVASRPEGAPPSRRGWPAMAKAVRAAAVLGGGVLAFDLVWAFNYDRVPVARLMGYADAGAATPISAAELASLASSLTEEAAELRATLPEDTSGALRLPDGRRGALSRAPLAYRPERLLPLPVPAVSGRPKAVLLSPLMSYLGITGIFIPFTSEANVNATLPDWEIPFTAAHELAHQRGYAREDEANYVAYRACRAHPDRDFRYSGTFRAALYVLAALAQADPAAFAQQRAGLAAPLRRDLAALAAWRQRYESRLGEVHDKVNHAYLKSQGQKEGVRSYGRVVDLLLAERRARDGTAGHSSQPEGRQTR